MRRFLLILAMQAMVLLSMAENTDSLAVANADWQWQQEGRMMVGQATLALWNSRQVISVVKYPMAECLTEMACDTGRYADKTSVLAQRYGAVAGLNAGYFNMKNRTHVTYLKDNGVVVGHTAEDEAYRCNGMVIFSEDGHQIDIIATDTTTDSVLGALVHEAISCGPLLIENGIRQTYTEDNVSRGWKWMFAKRHPRTIIGIDRQGWVYMIVVDGRSEEEAAGMTVEEEILLSEYLGLQDALNLDGGGSSTLWTAAHGVINYPCDNDKFDHEGERRVPSIIIVK